MKNYPEELAEAQETIFEQKKRIDKLEALNAALLKENAELRGPKPPAPSPRFGSARRIRGRMEG